MSKSWFVTGTDTEVGKTAVSCALLHAAANAGHRTAAVKPLAAGCDARGQNEDALQLMQSMTEVMDYEQVNPVALGPAIAPHIAAQQAKRRLQASRLAGLCRGVMMGGADFVLIEGAGGWRVPISPRETLADLARAVAGGCHSGGRYAPGLHQSRAADRRGDSPGWPATGGLGCQSAAQRMTATTKTWTHCGSCCRPLCWVKFPR